ncbi:MAG: sodium-dependent bicarbonate transport family permease [Geminicoccaceae bacterium]|nr:MAG: sodium-dependent bicarbonate transport family permease [Geminicoccaceae bacterium]
MLELAAANLLSPMVLFFVLGLIAALARVDLSFPEAIAKGLALYLIVAIGFKGGASLAGHGLDAGLVLALLAGFLLSALLPVIAFALLRLTTALPAVEAAAVAAHYGSISIVTFVAATQAVTSLGLTFEGYMVAVAAVMEAPAIVTALILARRGGGASDGETDWREVALNSSIVLLGGAFAIGVITGEEGLATVAPFMIDPFQGVLCLFLLDMGLVAGRGLVANARFLGPRVVAFGCYMPLVSALITALFVPFIGLSPGGAALLITLSASASYIAVPAAMRLALPEARPSIYLTLSLGVTFPFNLTVGIPLYVALGGWFT